MVNESALAFIHADPIIKSLSLPYVVHLMRVIVRNLILFAHSLVVWAAVMLYAGLLTRRPALRNSYAILLSQPGLPMRNLASTLGRGALKAHTSWLSVAMCESN